MVSVELLGGNMPNPAETEFLLRGVKEVIPPALFLSIVCAITGVYLLKRQEDQEDRKLEGNEQQEKQQELSA